MLVLEYIINEIIQYILNKGIFKCDLKRNQTSSNYSIVAVLLYYMDCNV